MNMPNCIRPKPSVKNWQREFAFAVFLLFSVFPASADYVIHVLNPWRDSDSVERKDTLWMLGNYVVGYYPGTKMINEGGGWFYYSYPQPLDKNQSHGFQIVSYVPTIYSPTDGRLLYPAARTLSIDSLFAQFSSQVTEIWIYIDDPKKSAQVLDHPKNGKVIHLFNPWPDNSPQIIIGTGTKKTPMRMRARQDICGWYTFYFAAPLDSLGNVQFTDYFHTERYTSLGLKTGPPIDLLPYLTTKDTVYILPQPFPTGAPVITSLFPGKTGECGFRKISGIFRDWKLDEASFFNDPTGHKDGGSTDMVQRQLTGPDFKPKKTTDASVNTKWADSLNTWFVTKKFANNTENDTCIDLTLEKSDDGRWTFDSDKMGGFFPLDSFNDSNNIKYYDRIDPKDPTGKMRNFHFTMEMHMQFIYHQGAGLEFQFRGDDDVWIFVNNTLAIDLGGLHERASATLRLDQDRTKLGLVDGQSYTMDIFYCERNPVSSNLLIRTTMDLHNSDELYYKEKVLGSGKIQYDIWQRMKVEGPDCGFTPLLNAETLATVKFILNGPGVIEKELVPGTHYGGIIVDPNQSRVTLDSLKINGLMPGDYRITYVSTFDNQRSGYLTFTVPPFPPDHYDIIPDSGEFDPLRDSPIDSIFLDIDLDETRPYAVVRDKNAYFLDYAVNPTWTSLDPGVVTVAQSTTDPSRCIVTKTGTGTTWIVVRDPKGKLKPDSLKIAAIYKPKFPNVVSAIMLDINADIIPDMISMTLSDTFKTGQVLDSVVLDYRGTMYSIPFSPTMLAAATLTVPFASTSGTDGRPSGQVTLVGTIGSEAARRTGNATDGVGPALVAADMLENEGTGPDTLYLIFSEPMLASSLTGKQLLLIKAGTTDTIALDIRMTVAAMNDSTFTVAIAVSTPRPTPGDLLRLAPKSAGGTLSDANKNNPHDLNRPVVLGFRAGPTSMVRAYYLDVNADGFIDRVVAVFKRPVQPSDFKAVRMQWSNAGSTKDETVSPDAVTKLSDSIVSLIVHGEIVSPNTPQTSGALIVLVEYNAFPDAVRSLTVADSAAPVIVSASLSYGNAEALDSTLTVVFSEPLQQEPGTYPFLLWSNRNTRQYQFKLALPSCSENTCRFLVDAIDAQDVSFAAQGDSIWINVAALITDTLGNSQLNPLNRRAILSVILPEPTWIASVSINPFNPGAGSTEISVNSKTPLLDPQRFSTDLFIYDAVGNQVLLAIMSQKDKGFTFTWNGRNKNQRSVGTGVYPAIIKISENSREAWVKKLKIGVKR